MSSVSNKEKYGPRSKKRKRERCFGIIGFRKVDDSNRVVFFQIDQYHINTGSFLETANRGWIHCGYESTFLKVLIANLARIYLLLLTTVLAPPTFSCKIQ